MMVEHHTQRARMSKVDMVEAMILKYGGWKKICDQGHNRDFLWIVARELNCTYSKAKEYVDIVIQSVLAKGRLERDKKHAVSADPQK